MTYEEYVLEVFREDQNCLGYDLEEINDIIEEATVSQIEKFLLTKGYNLKLMYNNDCK
jgi:hypothetical protein